MRNSEEPNLKENERHIAHLEEDYLATLYDMERIYRDLGERIKIMHSIERKFIKGESDGNNGNNKTN